MHSCFTWIAVIQMSWLQMTMHETDANARIDIDDNNGNEHEIDDCGPYLPSSPDFVANFTRESKEAQHD